MAKTKISRSDKESFLSRLNTTWMTIIAGLTIFGFGSTAGTVVAGIFHKIEINEINQKHNDQLYFQKKEFDNRIEELTHEIHLLEVENGEFRKK